ncbi:hypothetical protein BRC19_00805 [Candidatus Saccharibacteria bacterium QS_5_54_17]|nr:MAG: hypothetical protein BRC19_00805 [Candidatus Saccharibacteria bacterium QS_5_54_17]
MPFQDPNPLSNQVPKTDTATIMLFEFLNIALVLGGLIMFYKLMKRLDLSALTRNISLFMMATTLMFVFLAGGINYDNLLFLVAMSVFYFFVKFMQTRTLKSLLSLLILLVIAGLTKTAFMPIAAVVFVLTGYFAFRSRKDIFSQVRGVLRLQKKQQAILGVLLILLLAFGGLFVERYAVNLVEYGSVQPGCLQLHTHKQCSQWGVFSRRQKFESTPTTYEFDPSEFSIKWAQRMRFYTFSAIGHASFAETNLIKYGSYAFIGLMVIASIRKFDRREKEVNILLAISIFFILLLLAVNYFGAYMTSGIFGIALQGRYAFPVLPLLYAVGNHYVFKLLAWKWLKALYALFILVIFIPSGVIHYIFWTGKNWHTEYTPEIHHAIKENLRWFNYKVLKIFN